MELTEVVGDRIWRFWVPVGIERERERNSNNLLFCGKAFDLVEALFYAPPFSGWFTCKNRWLDRHQPPLASTQAAASDDLAWATGGLLLWAFVQPTKPTHFPELMM